DVVGIDVDAVIAGQTDGEFELSRQISFAVDRFDWIIARRGRAGRVRWENADFADIDAFAGFIVGKPDLVIRAGARVKLFHQFAGEFEHLFVNLVAVVGAGRAHDVPLHVAAGGERGELDVVDSPDGLLEILLQYAVELQALAGGDAERGVADFIAQVEFGKELIAGDAATGDGCADHEAVKLGLSTCAIAAGFGTALAVVLLVGAVVLQQIRVVFADELVAVAQLV